MRRGGEGGIDGGGKFSEGNNTIGQVIKICNRHMEDTQSPGNGVGRINWGGVGEWHISSVTGLLAPTGEIHANSLGLDNRVESEESLRGWICCSEFHRSIYIN